MDGPHTNEMGTMTMPDKQCWVIYCTCPDQTVAEHLANTLVDERLAACVNILPGITSVYVWEGKRQRDQEHLLIIKSCAGVYPRLTQRILALHPYDVPEIIALPIMAGTPAYLDWLRATTGV